MKETEVQTFAELHTLSEKYDSRTTIYRGVKSVKLPLTPMVGRIVPPESAKSREWNEREMLRLF